MFSPNIGPTVSTNTSESVKPWDLDRQHGGVRLLQPYQGRGEHDWYAGTADAILQNLNFLSENNADTALILSGDHIYKMDYGPMLDFHQRKGADLTIARHARADRGSAPVWHHGDEHRG